MRRTVQLTVSGAVIGLMSLVGTSAALAQDTAEYLPPEVLPTAAETPPDATLPTTAPDAGVSPNTASDPAPVSGRSAADRPTVLPFTGGEVVLIGAAGAIAVAAGTAMVAGGRRRAGVET